MKCPKCTSEEGSYREFYDYWLDEDWNEIPYLHTSWTCNVCQHYVSNSDEGFEHPDD